jgi:hypothetical protein
MFCRLLLDFLIGQFTCIGWEKGYSTYKQGVFTECCNIYASPVRCYLKKWPWNQKHYMQKIPWVTSKGIN